MKSFTLLTALLIAIASPFGEVAHAKSRSQIEAQYERSIRGALANVLSNGAVIASPSTSNPNYYFDWVRDTALTMKTLIQLQADRHLTLQQKYEVQRKLERWVDFELFRQETYKPTGLGEPRFYVDGRANLEPWGRPQNDGPALRALAAIELAKIWIQQGRMAEVKQKLYSAELPARTLIKRDLEYVAHHWKETSFDLWEEERAMHYYTLGAQMVALTKGAKLANSLGDIEAAKFYGRQAAQIQEYLRSFINPATGTIRYALQKVQGLPHKKSDLDIAVLLIANQTFDGRFYLPVTEVTRTVNAIVDEMRPIYDINKITSNKKGEPLGVALGRYRDDKYSGFDFSIGNPWFLATLGLAEFACNLKKVTNSAETARKLNDVAMGQFNRVLYHMGRDGSMAEQFRRDTGFMQGARDLTWSYTAYITAYRACFQ